MIRDRLLHRVWPGEARRRLTAPTGGRRGCKFEGDVGSPKYISADPRVGYRMVKGDMPEKGQTR